MLPKPAHYKFLQMSWRLCAVCVQELWVRGIVVGRTYWMMEQPVALWFKGHSQYSATHASTRGAAPHCPQFCSLPNNQCLLCYSRISAYFSDPLLSVLRSLASNQSVPATVNPCLGTGTLHESEFAYATVHPDFSACFAPEIPQMWPSRRRCSASAPRGLPQCPRSKCAMFWWCRGTTPSPS